MPKPRDDLITLAVLHKGAIGHAGLFITPLVKECQHGRSTYLTPNYNAVLTLPHGPFSGAVIQELVRRAPSLRM
jgi:hypothetical protein